MALEKTSWTIIFIASAVFLLLTFLSMFGYETAQYYAWIANIFVAAVLFVEIGIKKGMRFHGIKRYTVMQYVTMTLAVTSFLVGLYNIPAFEWSTVFSIQLGGFIGVIGVVFILIEWFSQQNRIGA